MNNAITILKGARDLIADKGWTKGTYARNLKGEGTYFMNDDATCFCMSGAVRHARYVEEDREEIGGRCLRTSQYAASNYLLEAIEETQPDVSSVPEYNDLVAKTKEEVLAVFDRAIELAEVHYVK